MTPCKPSGADFVLMKRGAEMVENEQAPVLIPVQEKAGLGMTALDGFTPLVQSYQRRIYRVLLGMVRDPDAAQTFGRLLKSPLAADAVFVLRFVEEMSLEEIAEALPFSNIVCRKPSPRDIRRCVCVLSGTRY